MTDLRVDLTPKTLNAGPDYEKVSFGLLEIEASGQVLTALVETGDARPIYRTGSYVSGYHLAEWLVWNWWRLRWEPCPSKDGVSSFEWDMAHRMTDIDEGYVWPNITISSDGFQCELNAERSGERDISPIAYLGAPVVTVPAADFENAVDSLVGGVLHRLDDAGQAETNLQKLWQDLTVERNDPALARFRRLEALLGFDPDEVDAASIESRLKDADSLGEQALDELAIGTAKTMLSASAIVKATAAYGFDTNSNDAFRLHCRRAMQWGQRAAWRIGADTANTVRQQAGLSDQPVSDSRLAELAGISVAALTADRCTNTLSWLFDSPQQKTPRTALRSRRRTGRRFDLARLIGDRLFSENAFIPAEPLLPATRSYSYRQKAQRRFAAELLSPWETVRVMLNNDYSEENKEQVAEYFEVSPLTISTLVDNNQGYAGNP